MTEARTGAALRAYLAATRAVPLLGPWLLQRRLARGKEHPDRWPEKLGKATLERPAGRLVWLHAVGLGEVMALRGLIAAMAAQEPDLSFLVTSTARSSAEVFGRNLPERTQHQFMPLDAPSYLRRFLDHWHPDLSVWAEQDLWPGAVVAAAERGIPVALVNARMNDEAFARRRRWRSLFADLYARFSLVAAQDQATARHLEALGARNVRVTGSLKSAASVLFADADELARMRSAMAGRRVWVAASTHVEDEAVVLPVQASLWRQDPSWLLVLVPRVPARTDRVLAALQADVPATVRSKGQGPTGAVYLADTVGELGIWYRLAEAAVMGGTFGPVEGHNPWEPAALGLAVLHGPRTANFAADYASLAAGGAALEVTVDALPAILTRNNAAMGENGRAMAEAARDNLAPLARSVLALRV